MTRLFAITAVGALLICLIFAACGTADKPEGEIESRPAAEENVEPEKRAELKLEPNVSPKPQAEAELPEQWTDLVEKLAPEHRPGLGEGVEPKLAASGRGEVELPIPGGATGSGETHTRHGWKMPDGHGGAIGVVRWADDSWKDVKIDIGVGICPHRGKRLVSDVSSTGTAVAHHAATAPADDPNWFIHVNADANQADKAGETLSYVWAMYSY
jgi:hypothetical protein